MDRGVSGGIKWACIFWGGANGGMVIEPSFKHTWFLCPNVWTKVARWSKGRIPRSIAFSSYKIHREHTLHRILVVLKWVILSVLFFSFCERRQRREIIPKNTKVVSFLFKFLKAECRQGIVKLGNLPPIGAYWILQW